MKDDDDVLLLSRFQVLSQSLPTILDGLGVGIIEAFLVMPSLVQPRVIEFVTELLFQRGLVAANVHRLVRHFLGEGHQEHLQSPVYFWRIAVEGRLDSTAQGTGEDEVDLVVKGKLGTQSPTLRDPSFVQLYSDQQGSRVKTTILLAGIPNVLTLVRRFSLMVPFTVLFSNGIAAWKVIYRKTNPGRGGPSKWSFPGRPTCYPCSVPAVRVVGAVVMAFQLVGDVNF